MEKTNYAFFEAFKRLDNLCQDIYGSVHGVTGYIDHMRSIPWNSHRSIPNWDEDLHQLIRLRHMRNHLAHAANAFDEEICTEADIHYLESFHGRILSRSDPIAQLFQIQRSQPASSRPTPRASSPTSVSSGRPPLRSREDRSIDAVWIFAGVMILFLLFFFGSCYLL